MRTECCIELIAYFGSRKTSHTFGLSPTQRLFTECIHHGAQSSVLRQLNIAESRTVQTGYPIQVKKKTNKNNEKKDTLENPSLTLPARSQYIFGYFRHQMPLRWSSHERARNQRAHARGGFRMLYFTRPASARELLAGQLGERPDRICARVTNQPDSDSNGSGSQMLSASLLRWFGRRATAKLPRVPALHVRKPRVRHTCVYYSYCSHCNMVYTERPCSSRIREPDSSWFKAKEISISIPKYLMYPNETKVYGGKIIFKNLYFKMTLFFSSENIFGNQYAFCTPKDNLSQYFRGFAALTAFVLFAIYIIYLLHRLLLYH